MSIRDNFDPEKYLGDYIPNRGYDMGRWVDIDLIKKDRLNKCEVEEVENLNRYYVYKGRQDYKCPVCQTKMKYRTYVTSHQETQIHKQKLLEKEMDDFFQNDENFKNI